MLFLPVNNKAYKLFHEGVKALSIVEANGIKVDEEYLAQAEIDCKKKIESLSAQIKQDPIYTKWRKHFGPSTNLGSREQLGTIIFDVMKYPCPERTATGRASTDEETLRDVEIPFVQNYMNMEKWKKALGTFLKGIQTETTNGYLHPFFNLHTVATFRSSGSEPNFHNFPIRRPEIAKLIRSAFIPRSPKRRIVEFDFKGIEVSVSACYNKDPVLIKYVSDATTDMHRDMAMQCYMLDMDQVNKLSRYATKNRFVFPEFYGNWYKAVAKDLWKSIKELKLVTNDGIPLKEHLREQGIRGLGKCNPELDAKPGTFEYHIKQVEDDFWNNRFKVYTRWKQDWNDAYVEKGYFDTLTGFRCSAMMNRKQCVNYPIQGSAFHCLLWSLIRVQKLLTKYNMKSLIVGQIHDSIIMDIVERELKDVMEMVRQVTTVDLANNWSWICVPLRIDVEGSEPGRSWYEKKEMKFQ
jgi:DNA polymerase-1